MQARRCLVLLQVFKCAGWNQKLPRLPVVERNRRCPCTSLCTGPGGLGAHGPSAFFLWQGPTSCSEALSLVRGIRQDSWWPHKFCPNCLGLRAGGRGPRALGDRPTARLGGWLLGSEIARTGLACPPPETVPHARGWALRDGQPLLRRHCGVVQRLVPWGGGQLTWLWSPP